MLTPQRTDRQPESAGQPRWARAAFGLLLWLVIVGSLYLGCLLYSTIRDAATLYHGGVPVQAASPIWSRAARINFLLMGTDEGRQCDAGIPRTDTMILASIDPRRQRADLISIPRDLWVDLPTRGVAWMPAQDRVNTAYFYGEAAHYPGGGPALARATVQQAFGRPIHYYAVVSMVGLRDIIDSLGGVDIDVKQALHDDAFPTDTCGYQTISFSPGVQHMDGEQALQYARSRHSTSDFDRADRQQQVLLAIRRRVLQISVIPRLPALLRAYPTLVQTDLSPIEMLALANMGKDIPAANIHRYTIGPDMVTDWVTPQGAEVLRPDWAKIHALLSEVFTGTQAAGSVPGR